jgi:hypothetical protein
MACVDEAEGQVSESEDLMMSFDSLVPGEYWPQFTVYTVIDYQKFM